MQSWTTRTTAPTSTSSSEPSSLQWSWCSSSCSSCFSATCTDTRAPTTPTRPRAANWPTRPTRPSRETRLFKNPWTRARKSISYEPYRDRIRNVSFSILKCLTFFKFVFFGTQSRRGSRQIRVTHTLDFTAKDLYFYFFIRYNGNTEKFGINIIPPEENGENGSPGGGVRYESAHLLGEKKRNSCAFETNQRVNEGKNGI